MKTYIIIILLGISYIFSFSQNIPFNEESEKEKMKKNGVYVQTKWKYRPGATQGVKVLAKTFDKQGNTIQELNFKPDGSNSSRLTYKYDSKGNKIYYQLYDFSQEPDKRIRYVQNIQYNDQGYRISETGFDGISDFKIEYKYISPGKLDELIKFNDKGEITEKQKYTYSDNKKLITIYDETPSIKEKISETYDSKGNLIERAKMQSDNSITKLNKYKYNLNNQLIEEEEYYGGKFSFKLTYNYDSDGNISSIDKEDADGKKFVNNSYSYDHKGNLIEEKWYDGVPDDYSKKSYNYDDNDNIKEVDSYYSLYKYKVLYKYTYEFY